jgi:hypothetical protein
MSNSGPLNDKSKAELAALARRRGVRGWESMTKADLLKALARATKAKPAAKPVPKAAPTRAAAKPVAKPTLKPAAKLTVKPARPASKPAPKSVLPAAAKPVVKPATPARPGVNGTHKALANRLPAKAEPKPAAAVKPAVVVKPAAKPPVPAKSAPVTKSAPLPRPSVPLAKDRIFLAVNDPYWLHVMWDVSPASVQRAEAALKQDWYGAKLILRLFDVTSQDTTSTSETPVRDIPVEADGRNWYIHIAQPPRQYRADIGYLSRRGDFFPLARSNVATPPKPGTAEALDAAWNLDAKQYERTLARTTGFESPGNPDMREYFEERLKKSLGAPKETGFGPGATPPGALKKFFFDINARLIVSGRTDPSAHVTLGNDPIKLEPDGTFVMSFSLPDSRQIIPAVATSADGMEERTIVLAVERNTKYLDPMIHDQMSET